MTMISVSLSISLYILYMYVQPFGLKWAPHKSTMRKRKAGHILVRGYTLSAQLGRKLVS